MNDFGRQSDPGAEIWTVIPGFDGVYEINYHGAVRRTRGRGKCSVKQSIKRGKGVAIVRLSDAAGVRKEYRVHQLMALTFLGPSPGKNYVLYHRNGIRSDNCVGNICWISKRELGRITGADAKRRPVIKIDQSGNIVSCYSSARAAGKANYMSYQAIIDRCNGKVKKHIDVNGCRYKWDNGEEVA